MSEKQGITEREAQVARNAWKNHTGYWGDGIAAAVEAAFAERTRALSQLEAGKVKPEQIEAAMKVSETFDLFQRRNGTYHRCSLSNDEITAIGAALASPSPAPEGASAVTEACVTPIIDRIQRLIRDLKDGAILGYDGPQEYWSARMGAEASAEIGSLLEAALSHRPPVPDAPEGARMLEELEEVRKAVFGDVGDEPNVYADYDKCSELAGKMRRAIAYVATERAARALIPAPPSEDV